MKYRPDIDGLRAIAIIFVLFFHAGLTLFPSGFIGVDIFFVISGCLITGIINESLQNNHFSFIQFYNRRLWRLQPVFICLLVITTLITLFFYLPDDLIQYFKSARKTSLFISNNFFERATTDYFSSNNNQLPLLHTWSLSIEWQCYLILPIVIYLFHRMLGKKCINIAIYSLTLLFFVLTLYFSSTYPTKNYYHLLSRVFEFLIGSCVALSHNRFSLNKYFSDFISVTAVFILFYVATRHSINIGFPNWYALVVCIATGILITTGGQHPGSLLTQFLSGKPIVFIGLISYSLYIWHWPILALIRYLDIKETTTVLSLAFVLIFIIAYLSWRFIEKKARKFNTAKFSLTLVCLLILPITIIHISDYLIKNNEGYPQRFEETAAIEATLKQFANSQRPLCLQEKNIEVSSDCALGAQKAGSKTAFMIGDSYANHYWGFIDTLAKNANLSVMTHGTVACLSLPGIVQNDWNSKVYNACHEQTARYYNMIKSNHYDFVILGQNWSGYLQNKLIIESASEQPKDRIEKSLNEALQLIIAAGSTPVLIKSIVVPGNPHDCFFAHIKQRKKYIAEFCDFDLVSEKQQWQNDLFVRMKNKYAQLIIIDPENVECPNGRCKADINGIPVFRDEGHITDYASYFLATVYLKHNKNPLIIVARISEA